MTDEDSKPPYVSVPDAVIFQTNFSGKIWSNEIEATSSNVLLKFEVPQRSRRRILISRRGGQYLSLTVDLRLSSLLSTVR